MTLVCGMKNLTRCLAGISAQADARNDLQMPQLTQVLVSLVKKGVPCNGRSITRKDGSGGFIS